MLHLNSLPSLFFSASSFLIYAALAMFQTVANDGNIMIYKDVGMGAAFTATCFFMVRYFVAQIDKKDETNKELSTRLTDLIEKKILSDAETKAKLIELIQKVEGLHEKKR